MPNDGCWIILITLPFYHINRHSGKKDDARTEQSYLTEHDHYTKIKDKSYINQQKDDA